MRDVEQLLSAYEVDVDFPDVSGMEHLQMLSTRSQLCKAEGELNSEQRKRLERADQKLLRQAEDFFQAVTSIANLSEWRRTQDAAPEEWWWYLDVLVELPTGTLLPNERAIAS
jgi:hypothetical protein